MRTGQTVLAEDFAVAGESAVKEVGVITGLALHFIVLSGSGGSYADEQEAECDACSEDCFQHSI